MSTLTRAELQQKLDTGWQLDREDMSHLNSSTIASRYQNGDTICLRRQRGCGDLALRTFTYLIGAPFAFSTSVICFTSQCILSERRPGANCSPFELNRWFFKRFQPFQFLQEKQNYTIQDTATSFFEPMYDDPP